MYILAKQRDTIARTLEPTKERDSRNVSGPLTDRRPSCRDLTPKSYLRLTTWGRATKATRNYYWLLPLRSPGPGAAIFATFAFSTSHVEVYSISKIFPPLHIGKSAYWIGPNGLRSCWGRLEAEPSTRSRNATELSPRPVPDAKKEICRAKIRSGGEELQACKVCERIRAF